MVGGRRTRDVSMVPATQLEGNVPASTAETMIVDLEDEEEDEDEDEDADEDDE